MDSARRQGDAAIKPIPPGARLYDGWFDTDTEMDITVGQSFRIEHPDGSVDVLTVRRVDQLNDGVRRVWF